MSIYKSKFDYYIHNLFHSPLQRIPDNEPSDLLDLIVYLNDTAVSNGFINSNGPNHFFSCAFKESISKAKL